MTPEFPERVLERARREIPLRVVVDAKGCWRWQGTVHNGYGTWHLILGRSPFRVHRLSYAAFIGPIPLGALILHRCDVKDCCNPEHVFSGDHATNMRDAVVRERMACGDANGSRKHLERRPRGESVNTAKLSAEQVRQLRKLAERGIATVALATQFGVSRATVRRIVTREYWAHVD